MQVINHLHVASTHSYLTTFQFLFRQAVSDDETSTRLLQILLFLLLDNVKEDLAAKGMNIRVDLLCSFLLPLGLLSHYPSTSLVVFLCILFPPIVRTVLLPEVYLPPSLLCARTMSAFFF